MKERGTGWLVAQLDYHRREFNNHRNRDHLDNCHHNHHHQTCDNVIRESSDGSSWGWSTWREDTPAANTQCVQWLVRTWQQPTMMICNMMIIMIVMVGMKIMIRKSDGNIWTGTECLTMRAMSRRLGAPVKDLPMPGDLPTYQQKQKGMVIL